MFQKIIVFLFAFFVVHIAFGQGGGFPVDPSAVGAPIDGGLSLLLAAGAAYGAKKVYDFRNNQDKDEELK